LTNSKSRGGIKILFKKGAEANLFKEIWYGRSVLKKVRIPKSYRHPLLDEKIRKARTIHEAKLLSEVRALGISTPIVYYIDLKHTAIFMEFIEGFTIKELLFDSSTDLSKICINIGKIIGTLHKNNIIHGDLTTSNIILESKTQKMFLIDFGLSEYSTTVESRGVDLHLIHRALQSTHINLLDPCFDAILKGYLIIMGQENTDDVLQRLKEIENRGRYH